MWVGGATKAEKAEKWAAGLMRHLAPGEAITAVSKMSRVKPAIEGLALTDQRLLAFYAGDLAGRAPILQLRLYEIDTVEVKATFLSPNLLQVTTKSGEVVKFGDLPSADAMMVRGLIETSTHRAATSIATAEPTEDVHSDLNPARQVDSTPEWPSDPRNGEAHSAQPGSVSPGANPAPPRPWYQRKAVIAGAVFAALVAAGNAFGDSADTSSASTKARPDTGSTAAALEPVQAEMPFLEEQPLDAAWPAVEAAATRVTVHDMSLRNRDVGPSRSDWKVCTQNIPAGSPYRGLVIDFGVVALGEECITEVQRDRAIAKAEAKAEARKEARMARERARRARQRAVEARERAEENRTPVLDAAALSACNVLAQLASSVVTDQDRSDFARAFNYYARSSSERKIVEAGEALTDSVDSWTGFMWDGSVALAAEVCIDGGAGR